MGVLTLGGFVASFAQKSQAKRVAGVVSVAKDIEVRVPVFDERPEPEIVRDVVSALKSELPYRPEAVRRERKSASARTSSFHFIPNVAYGPGCRIGVGIIRPPNDGRIAVIRN
jgi:hypothetical protein